MFDLYLTLAIRSELGLWLAWILPLLFPLIVWGLADWVWRNSSRNLTVRLNDFRGIFVAATSVLAIVVPLTGSLILDVRGSTATVSLGLLLAAATLAVLALVLGAYLIYGLSSITGLTGDNLSIVGGRGSQNSWAAILGSVQFSCLIMFLVTALSGLALFAISVPDEQAATTGETIGISTRAFPEIGTDIKKVSEQLGPPSRRGPGWLEYELPSSKVLLCFSRNTLETIMEFRQEVTHAIQRTCTVDRSFPRPR